MDIAVLIFIALVSLPFIFIGIGFYFIFKVYPAAQASRRMAARQRPAQARRAPYDGLSNGFVYSSIAERSAFDEPLAFRTDDSRSPHERAFNDPSSVEYQMRQQLDAMTQFELDRQRAASDDYHSQLVSSAYEASLSANHSMFDNSPMEIASAFDHSSSSMSSDPFNSFGSSMSSDPFST